MSKIEVATPGPWGVSVADCGYIYAITNPANAYIRVETRNPADARLMGAAHELLAAATAYQAAQAMTLYGDSSDFVWPAVTMRKPGDRAWGSICEKHGLGYQGGCICCASDFRDHKDDKDRQAVYRRNDALREASEMTAAALALATGSQS